MEIKKGNRFVCIKSLSFEGDCIYKKGNVYTSDNDGCITDEKGNKEHYWDTGIKVTEFIPYSKLDKVYTKHTEKLQKLFDVYEGKKHDGSIEKTLFFDNVIGGETGWFVSTTGLGDWYYSDEGYTYLSEQAFIEFMDLEVDKLEEEEVKESERILSEAKQRQEEHDAINPQHYKGKIEVIDFIEDKGLGFHLANAVKYIARAGKKDPSKVKEDLKKAIWYIERYIETYLDND